MSDLVRKPEDRLSRDTHNLENYSCSSTYRKCMMTTPQPGRRIRNVVGNRNKIRADDTLNTAEKHDLKCGIFRGKTG